MAVPLHLHRLISYTCGGKLGRELEWRAQWRKRLQLSPGLAALALALGSAGSAPNDGVVIPVHTDEAIEFCIFDDAIAGTRGGVGGGVGAVLSNLGQRGELRKEMTQLSLTQAGGQHRRLCGYVYQLKDQSSVCASTG